MGTYVFLALLAVPLLEIAVFIQVGGLVGLGPTLALVVLTAVAGAALLRRQGLSTLLRARASLERNVLPVREVFDGLCLVAAGALLLTPGFVTDTLGLALFVPGVRNWLRCRFAAAFRRRAETRVFVDGVEVHRSGPDTIDGEFRDLTGADGAPAESRWRPPEPPAPR